MQLFELYNNQTYLFMASVINQTLCRSNDKQNITRIEMSNQINYWHNNANKTLVLIIYAYIVKTEKYA